MKTLFVSLFSLLLIHQSFAQNKEGTIHYKETIQLAIDLEQLENLPEAIKAQLPTEKSSETVLRFHPKASLYTNAPKDKNEAVEYKSGDGGIQMQIKLENTDRTYFYDVSKRKSTESQEFFGKKFLIENTKPRKWKIGNETKEILSYTCKKATTTSDKGELVEVWFTSEIPVEVGPSTFHGLPGAILSVRKEKENYELVATKVAFEKIDRTVIVAPTKGKKVKAAQFKEIVVAKQKEMIEEYGGDGNMIIKTEMIER